VEIAFRAGQLDLIVVEAAKAVGDGRDAFAKHGSVGDDEGIGFQFGFIVLNEVPQADAANFFLAFDEDLDVNGEFTVDVVKGFEGLQVDVNLAFVVGGAAAKDVAVADGRFESGRSPKVQRFGGLDVVVSVEKNGGFARSFEGFGVDERVEIGGDNFDGFETRGTKPVGNPGGGTFDIGFMFALGANRRDSEKFEKLIQMLFATTFDEFSKVHYWASGDNCSVH
jgi:hypothetical protein